MLSYKWKYALKVGLLFESRFSGLNPLILKKGAKNMDTVPDGNRIPVHLCEKNSKGMFFAAI